MGHLFRYKLPTTKRWYIRHRLDNHLAISVMTGYLVGWTLGIYWAYMLLN